MGGVGWWWPAAGSGAECSSARLGPSEGGDIILITSTMIWQTSPVAQEVKHLPTVWETRVLSLGGEGPLEWEMAAHSSTLVWKIPWMEEPGRLQSTGSQRVNMTERLHKQQRGNTSLPINRKLD